MLNVPDKINENKLSQDQIVRKESNLSDDTFDEKKADQVREQVFHENADVKVPIKPIYYAAKKVTNIHKHI